MSIANKQMLLREMEEKLGDVVTANDLTSIMGILSECLSVYEVNKSEDTSYDAESEELLAAFLDTKRIEGRSDKTLERYEYLIRRVYESINVPIRKISVFHLRKYLADEKARGISDGTLDGIRQVLSSYFGWLQKEGLLTENPTVNLGAIKATKRVRKPFTSVDIERLKECCTCDRDKAIISFLLSTGCRISEVCALNRDSVDFHKLEVVVLGKGSKERTVYLDEVTSMLLRRYLLQRKDECEALFVGKGERLHPGGVRRMLNRVAARAGVENVHPHRCRRTLATNLIDHGMPIQEVAAILGHDKLDTTMKYVYQSSENIKSSYRRYA